MTAPTFEISEGTVPEVTVNRQPEHNPFTEKFPTAEGKALVVNMPNPKTDSKDDANLKAINKVVSLARRAGEAKGLTARVKRTPGVDKKGKENGTTDLTIWTVTRITRPRKTAESASK